MPLVIVLAAVALVAASAIPALASGRLSSRHRSLADKLRHGPGIINHPVGVVPSDEITVPKDWPLNIDGSITCVTCHTSLPSLNENAMVSLRGVGEPESDNAAFCAKCHSSGGRRSTSSMHWMAVGVAHVRAERDRTRRSVGRLDSESRQCLGCHDGVNASESVNGAGRRGHVPMVGNGGEHPIGLDYSLNRGKNGVVFLRPENLLPEQVRLPNGRMSCVSCHNLYARDRHRLTVPIEGSALCFTCHNMD